MMRLISLLSLGIAAAALPQMAAAQSATLQPGLYDVSKKVVMTGGRVTTDKVTEDCIRAGDNVKTLDGLLLDFTKRKNECTLGNVQETGSTLRANFTCKPLPSGGKVGGTIEAEYGADRLNYVIDSKFGPIASVTVTKGFRRTGECLAP